MFDTNLFGEMDSRRRISPGSFSQQRGNPGNKENDGPRTWGKQADKKVSNAILSIVHILFFYIFHFQFGLEVMQTRRNCPTCWFVRKEVQSAI